MTHSARCATSLAVVAFAALCPVLAGCGGSASVDTKGKIAVGHKTLSVSGVPFTFEYPVDFQEATDESAKSINAVAVVGPEANSYIAVRHNGDQPMSPGALERQARRALGESILTAVRETHAGVPMVAITVADTGGQALGLRSTIYGFSAAGGTWMIECHSTRAQRKVMTAACRQTLDTIKEGKA